MNNKINRPEEQFDERANEDSYFAAKEHELIDVMKTEYQNTEAARREACMMICPKCSGRLAKYKFMGFVVDRCETCEGIWLNKGELAGILRQRARGPLGALLDRYFAKDEPASEGP